MGVNSESQFGEGYKFTPGAPVRGADNSWRAGMQKASSPFNPKGFGTPLATTVRDNVTSDTYLNPDDLMKPQTPYAF